MGRIWMGKMESIVFAGLTGIRRRCEHPWRTWAVRGPVYVTHNAGGGPKGDNVQKGVGTRLTDCCFYETFTGFLDYKGL